VEECKPLPLAARRYALPPRRQLHRHLEPDKICRDILEAIQAIQEYSGNFGLFLGNLAALFIYGKSATFQAFLLAFPNIFLGFLRSSLGIVDSVLGDTWLSPTVIRAYSSPTRPLCVSYELNTSPFTRNTRIPFASSFTSQESH